jgi:hypothetical protein
MEFATKRSPIKAVAFAKNALGPRAPKRDSLLPL